MVELIAITRAGVQQWRRPLPEEPVTLGRIAPSDWKANWDTLISTVHATLHWQAGRLHVSRRLLPKKTTNPIFFKGKEQDEFVALPGDHFVIGTTRFVLADASADPEPPTPYEELTCSADELRRHQYVDANERIEVLASLPAVIRMAPSDAELEARVLEVLLRGVPRAEAAAIVRLDPTAPADAAPLVRGARERGRPALNFIPSRRLVHEAVRKRRQSVLHSWHGGGSSLSNSIRSGDWALCSPLPDEPAPGWAIYLTGSMPDDGPAGPGREDLLKSDLKFAELVAEVFGSLRQVSALQRRQGQLDRFLSRPVLAALAGHDMEEVLRPRKVAVTVLFCDLRGSCRIAEQGQEELLELWGRVSAALAAMSGGILDQDGVIGDFQGDATMGFWGWPLDVADQIERAARAALTIRRRFVEAARDPSHPLAGFTCGLGMAHGEAVAGRLGTSDQFKIDVFGPVVNLASRLESMTKRFDIPILVDEACGKRLSDPANRHWVRCRRLARVQPFGMQRQLTIFELLPPSVDPGSRPESQRLDHEAALDAFFAGRWAEARALLERLPADGAGTFILRFMEEHPDGPPGGASWNGVIALDGK